MTSLSFSKEFLHNMIHGSTQNYYSLPTNQNILMYEDKIYTLYYSQAIKNAVHSLEFI